MGTIKKNYAFKGLDTRTNKLYRQDATASDCRNVRLDTTRKLVKINDMDKVLIPRGILGETGSFDFKLPFHATIIDIMPYDFFFVLVTSLEEEVTPGAFRTVNKFYKWIKSLNTVTFIPFEKETFLSTTAGQLVNKVGVDISGGVMYTNMENVLYFIGSKYPTYSSVTDHTLVQSDKDNNRSPVLTYDGTVIGTSGCPSILEDSQKENAGIKDPEDYIRLLPFKVDGLGRHTFGNFSTHLGTQSVNANGHSFIQETITPKDSGFAHHAFLEISADIALNDGSGAAARTIPCTYYSRSGGYKSAAKGQILYGIRYQYTFGGGPVAGTTLVEEFYEFYRCTIEATDYVGNTVTLGSFKRYDVDLGIWKSNFEFRHVVTTATALGTRPGFLSNIMTAVYGSQSFVGGYTLKGFVNIAYDTTTSVFDYATPRGYTGANPLFEGKAGIAESSDELLFISSDLNDIIETTTVKLPPPKVKSLTNYVGAMVVSDEKSLYFSDFSTGGNIETFTPFDTFGFGSTDKGDVTGVFSNETFLVGFREQEAYYITGNIFTANYRIQSYKSTRIGCSDPRSIIGFRGAGLFASEKGIFVAAQGGNMEEISDSIENIFTADALGLGVDMFDVKTVVDFKREYIYFSIGGTTPVILAYSYYFNEWFLYDYINTSGGFDLIDGLLYSSDGTNMYVENTLNKKEAVAYYRSNFETVGVPSFSKKFLQVLLYTIDMASGATIGFKTYKNWITSESETDEEKSVEIGQVDVVQRFNPDRSKSVAIEINSASNNELTLNGYEYEYSDDVKMFKNDD